MEVEISLRTIILLILIIVFGIIATISDVKNKKIHNKTIIIFLILGLVLNLANSKPWIYKFNYLLNLLLAVFVGFFLWYINFWNAGDGKLFSGFVALVPLDLIINLKDQFFFYNIIVYTFVPVFFVFTIFLVLEVNRKELFQALKMAYKPGILISILISFFAFQWIIELVSVNFGIRLNLFISAIILFFVLNSLEKILRLRLINVLIAITIIRLVIDFRTVFSWSFAYNFFIQLIVFLVFVNLFLYLGYFKFGRHVKISDLKPGMILCEKVVKKGEKYTVIPDIKISLFMFLHEKFETKPIIEAKPEGLSRKEINKIQTWNKEKKMEVGALLIQKRVPYAPFQFLGVIIFIITSIIIP
jgi:Flp pilus assembly protein protease CpaA